MIEKTERLACSQDVPPRSPDAALARWVGKTLTFKVPVQESYLHLLSLVSLQDFLFQVDLPEKLIVLAVCLSSTLLGYMKERKEI